MSRGSLELHTAQSQAMTGTPWLVPVPKNVSFIKSVYQKKHAIARPERSEGEAIFFIRTNLQIYCFGLKYPSWIFGLTIL